MIKFRKKIFIIIITLCCLTLYSCDIASIVNQNSDEFDPRSPRADSYPFAESTMETVLKCLDENDGQTLKGLFSESVIQKYDVDKQIEDAMAFYEGASVSCDEVHSDNRRGGFDGEYYYYKSINIEMNVVTDQNKKYILECLYVLVDDEQKTNVGLSKLFVSDYYDHIENYCLVGDNGNYSKATPHSC